MRNRSNLCLFMWFVLASMGCGGDVNVVLDSSNGSSAFRVMNSSSNAIIEATSGNNLRLGAPCSEKLDQQQTLCEWFLIGSTAWQSFRPSMSGLLTRISICGYEDEEPQIVLLSVLDGEGASGPVLWTTTLVIV
ncbi:MAG: hypothetical protein N2255_03615 [Kiritimatiellae bacterium]|nr:hypothetical protein [Kiritimatiellia bacterium]